MRLEKTANVDSEIYHCSFAAEEGARIKGSLRSKDEPLDQQPNDAQVKANGPAKGSGRSKEQSLNEHIEATEGSAA